MRRGKKVGNEGMGVFLGMAGEGGGHMPDAHLLVRISVGFAWVKRGGHLPDAHLLVRISVGFARVKRGGHLPDAHLLIDRKGCSLCLIWIYLWLP
ncbi:hypothetical protein DLD77_01080 [Chitinophaga alhagiae]|uniref:Uncharacterized protein n=1 Tax=Chitinophaga alhagiae TaxID=2203219 RepID=A0ABM6W8Z8_9BACT|nr:hypothetical protein DLD77_01080 [Chitinophaga alhagiae]